MEDGHKKNMPIKLNDKKMKWTKSSNLVNILKSYYCQASLNGFYITLLAAGFKMFQYESSFYLCSAGKVIVYSFLHLQAF